jgi:DNA-binding NarL/FixJ family response regulator
MISLHDAIRALNPSVVNIRGEQAFDKDEKPVAYDLSAAQAKLTQMQADEAQAQQTAEAHRQSAIAKLSALGLTNDEINALGVK